MTKYRIVPHGLDEWKIQMRGVKTNSYKSKGWFGSEIEPEYEWETVIFNVYFDQEDVRKLKGAYFEPSTRFVYGRKEPVVPDNQNSWRSHKNLEFVKECLEFVLNKEREALAKQRKIEERLKTVKPIEYEA